MQVLIGSKDNDKSNQELNKRKHVIKPSAELRTERKKGLNGVPKCALNAITHQK